MRPWFPARPARCPDGGPPPSPGRLRSSEGFDRPPAPPPYRARAGSRWRWRHNAGYDSAAARSWGISTRLAIGRGPMIAPSGVEIMEKGLPRFCRARVGVGPGLDRRGCAPDNFELAIGLNLTHPRSAETVIRIRVDTDIAARSLQSLVEQRPADLFRLEALCLVYRHGP